MDTITHFLIGLILAFAFFNDKQNAERIATVLLSIAPDIFLSGFSFVKYCNLWFNCNLNPPWVWIPYDISHSIITFVALGVLCWFFLRNWFLPFILGWGSAHLLIDLLTHTGSYSIRILYPLNNMAFVGFGMWTEYLNAIPGIWVCLLVLLGIVIVVKDEKKKKEIERTSRKRINKKSRK